jgi:hypothetical protein
VVDNVSNLIFVDILAWQWSRDVVLHLGWLRLAGHPKVSLNPNGNGEDPLVVKVVAASFRVARLGPHGKGELGHGLLQSLGGRLDKHPHCDLTVCPQRVSHVTLECVVVQWLGSRAEYVESRF